MVNPLSRELDRIVKLDARKDKMRSLIGSERGKPIYILVSNGISRWYRASSLAPIDAATPREKCRSSLVVKRFLNSAGFYSSHLRKKVPYPRPACFDPAIYHYVPVHGSLRPSWAQFAPPWRINIRNRARCREPCRARQFREPTIAFQSTHRRRFVIPG